MLGKADEQGDQCADEHGNNDAQRDLHRHIKDTGVLSGPGSRETKHSGQRQTTIQREIDHAGALGDRLAQAGDNQRGRGADDAAQCIEKFFVHTPHPPTPCPPK